MEVTDSQFLPYPEGTDPGDGALDIQVLAEAIDAKLVAAFAAIREVVNTPAFISQLSANQTGVASGVTTIISYNQILYNSTGVFQNADIPFFAETGYYRLGTYTISNPSAGITANSSRRTFLEYRRQLTLPAFTFVSEFFDTTTLESSTGGEHQTCDALVRVDSIEPPGSSLRVNYLHLNAASTMNIIAGSMLWFYKVSELEGI